MIVNGLVTATPLATGAGLTAPTRYVPVTSAATGEITAVRVVELTNVVVTGLPPKRIVAPCTNGPP